MILEFLSYIKMFGLEIFLYIYQEPAEKRSNALEHLLNEL